jgi:hypothetical protein
MGALNFNLFFSIFRQLSQQNNEINGFAFWTHDGYGGGGHAAESSRSARRTETVNF